VGDGESERVDRTNCKGTSCEGTKRKVTKCRGTVLFIIKESILTPNHFSTPVIKSSFKYFFSFGRDRDHDAGHYSLDIASSKVFLLMKVTWGSSHNLHHIVPHIRRLDGWMCVFSFLQSYPHPHSYDYFQTIIPHVLQDECGCIIFVSHPCLHCYVKMMFEAVAKIMLFDSFQ
jgi:hypothetical protein